MHIVVTHTVKWYGVKVRFVLLDSLSCNTAGTQMWLQK